MNFTHKAWVKLSTFLMPRDSKSNDKGAGFVEYGAIIVFVAIVAGLLYSSNIGTLITQGITRAISRVFSPE